MPRPANVISPRSSTSMRARSGQGKTSAGTRVAPRRSTPTRSSGRTTPRKTAVPGFELEIPNSAAGAARRITGTLRTVFAARDLCTCDRPRCLLRARAAAALTALVARACFDFRVALVRAAGACFGAACTTAAGGGRIAGGGTGAGAGAGVVDAGGGGGAGGGGRWGSFGGSGRRPAAAPWGRTSEPALRTVQTHTPSIASNPKRRKTSAGPTATHDVSPIQPAQDLSARSVRKTGLGHRSSFVRKMGAAGIEPATADRCSPGCPPHLYEGSQGAKSPDSQAILTRLATQIGSGYVVEVETK
jgi:hypothetical protein